MNPQSREEFPGTAGVPPAQVGPGEVRQITVRVPGFVRAGRPRSQGLRAQTMTERIANSGSASEASPSVRVRCLASVSVNAL